MAAACAFIDVVGCYGAQFTPDQHKRAVAKRADVKAARAKSAAASEEAVDRALALRQKKGHERAVRPPPPPPGHMLIRSLAGPDLCAPREGHSRFELSVSLWSSICHWLTALKI